MLLDLSLPDISGKELIKKLSDLGLKVPFLVMTGQGDTRMAVEMMKLGASDYLQKDTSLLEILPEVLNQVLRSLETEEKLRSAEVAILERDARLHKLASLIPGMIYQFMQRPDGTYCVPYTSEGIRSVFGLTPADVADDFTPVTRVIYPDDLPLLLNSIAMSAKELTEWECEYRVQLPGRPAEWMFGHSIPEKLADGSILWHGFNYNITERKQAEKELIHAKEKAEEADRLKSAFLANMSHEIRTPMNGILGFADILLDQDLSVDDRERYVRIIQSSGERLLKTVNDIIEISKIETGQIALAYEELDLCKEIRELVRFYMAEAEKKGLVFRYHLTCDELRVHSDSVKLNSILSNLIKNAVKFTDIGFITIGVEKTDDHFLVYIRDTGDGIPKHRQQAIFNRFEQADLEDKKALQGSGLGLAIAKSYVELLGGNIWVESIEKQGSTFYVKLPFTPVNEQR
jgi:signal transduction histidine kinase